MPVTSITYSRKFNPAQYESEDFSFTYELDSGQDPAQVITYLKNMALNNRTLAKQGAPK